MTYPEWFDVTHASGSKYKSGAHVFTSLHAHMHTASEVGSTYTAHHACSLKPRGGKQIDGIITTIFYGGQDEGLRSKEGVAIASSVMSSIGIVYDSTQAHNFS
jgi:hypothetical protein